MRKLQEARKGKAARNVEAAPDRAKAKRISDLKGRCCDDFKRLKASLEDLAKEAGGYEVVRFVHSMYVLNSMGLKLPW